MRSRNFALILLSTTLWLGGALEAQCTNVLASSLMTDGHSLGWPAVAQTFSPASSGTVCEIRHSVFAYGGITAYNLYVVAAPGTGAPPTNYATSYLFRALNQTNFAPNPYVIATVRVGDGSPSSGFTVTAAQRYAVIVEPVNGGVSWHFHSNNPYAGGEGFLLAGGNWMTFGYPRDFRFEIVALPPPPNNDPCAGCIPIDLGTVNGTIVSATTDGSSACGGVNDVWYCYTARCSGQVVVNTCTSTFDSVVSVYPSCGGAEIVCNDDCPGTPCFGPGSCLLLNAVCGVTYRIRVASFDGLLGTFALTLSQPTPPTPPANDNIANATNLNPAGVVNLPFSTCGATTDGPAGCAIANDIWYVYTPDCQGTVSVDLCGSNLDTYMAVYTGPPGNLVLVPGTCNDDDGPLCPGRQSSVRFNGNPCTTYRIRVGGHVGQVGCGDLTVQCTVGPAANDRCSEAIPIGPGTIQGSTLGATPLQSEATTLAPGPCGTSLQSLDVWYSYTPPCNGQLTLDTCQTPCAGGLYDTVLSVYTGLCSAVLTQVEGACNDEDACAGSPFCCSSKVVTNVTGGVDYKIRVSGSNGDAGSFALRLAFFQPPLTNDEICSATQIGCGAEAFSTCDATTSPEPSPGCSIFNDVWYRFTTPNCAGTVSVDTCSSPLDTVIAVYTGTCAAPVFVGCNDNAAAGPCAGSPWSYVTFSATASTAYYVRVGARVSGATGNGVLRVSCPPGLALCPDPPPCLASPASVFDVIGRSGGTAWAFRLTIPCCFDRYVPVVNGVTPSMNPDPTLAQREDEAALREAFVTAINLACPWPPPPPLPPPIATSYPFNGNTVTTYGKFGIKACHCGTNLGVTLAVGPPNTPPADLCTVTTQSLPTFGPCSFNPDIVQVELPGIDCNGNGEDDYVDILNATSQDVDLDNIPDECDGGSLTAFCFPSQNGVIACPCGNPPAGGGIGCDNFGGGPAQSGTLRASGVASLAADTIVLNASGENNTSTTIFLQSPSSSATGVVFGAGVRCITGSLKRLYTGSAAGGSISRPQGTDPNVHTRSAALGDPLSAGITRYYMSYYRDPAATGACSNPAATFNCTNSGALAWKP